MKILILSTAIASHTIKWVRSLSYNNDIVLFSFPSPEDGVFDGYPRVKVESLNVNAKVTTTEGMTGKFVYLKALPLIKKLIKDFKPDILHAHWATSYGLLGSLIGFHPYVLSVWGADVYDFPKKSFLHASMVRFNFKSADRILSTSHVMAGEIKKYTKKKISITPFGIDTDLFKAKAVENIFDKNSIVVGTVKTLESKYGIDYLINAFCLVRRKHPEIKLKLLIVGGGSQEASLRSLSGELGIESSIVFTGRVKYDDVPAYYNMLDIYVAVSVLDSESFGVAVLEASACEKPVIVSDVGGLPEVVIDHVTGLVVPSKNIEATANAIENLVLDEELRKKFGAAGRKSVLEKYKWHENVNLMRSIYNDVIKE